MKDLIESIQSLPKEYHLEACLSLHAAILSRQHIPRVYINSDNSLNSLEHIISVLLTDNKLQLDNTVNLIHKIGSSIKSIGSMDDDTKQQLLISIDEILTDKFGCGEIFYDVARYTPFTTEDITTKISNEFSHSFIKFLKNRQYYLHEYQEQYDNIHKSILYNTKLSIFDEVLKHKIDLHWQRRWKDSRHYNHRNSDEELVSRLFLANEL